MNEVRGPMSKGAANGIALRKMVHGKWATVRPLPKVQGQMRMYEVEFEVTKESEAVR